VSLVYIADRIDVNNLSVDVHYIFNVIKGFPFNLHCVAILYASKLFDFFHPLINRREMTVRR
jgi:hypothetical protein